MLGLAMADFGRDPRSSDSSRGSRKFFWLGKQRTILPFSQILHTTTSIGVAM